jgi:hypothetical protein
MRKPLKAISLETGAEVAPGTVLPGEWILRSCTRVTEAGKSGKVYVEGVEDAENKRELYAHIFGLKVVEV